MVGRIGRGRKTCTTPSITSRVLAASPMLLVELLLHGEADAHADAPGRDAAVLDDGGDAIDLHLGLDALQRGEGARNREAHGVLDGVRRRPRQLDRLPDQGAGPPPPSSRPGSPGGGKVHAAHGWGDGRDGVDHARSWLRGWTRDRRPRRMAGGGAPGARDAGAARDRAGGRAPGGGGGGGGARGGRGGGARGGG